MILARPLIAAIAAAIMCSSHADAAELAQYQWSARVLLLFAASPADSLLVRQRQALAAAAAGLAERDIVVIEVTGEAHPPLRARFQVAPDAFAIILIGKDGGEKRRDASPVAVEALFTTIDAMPMRRSEARR